MGMEHTMEIESYQGHGIIPWDHTMGSYHGDHTMVVESYHWDHTKAMESYHGIIPRTWNYTMAMESYHGHGIILYHAQRFSYNIYILEQVYSQ